MKLSSGVFYAFFSLAVVRRCCIFYCPFDAWLAARARAGDQLP
ncbi:hypothetical protein ACP_1240 [Acidobacterium capsulatum ATCC 51196]|uniref:Uncharacterized protein n=1 Tax=Acidobacterium capsulatum (strain ATCC 51196 / DSM 11244 / BCRC 80197 / JCM 7670 / NBRC 15755 / NCIMB 13165 / 161) TaxID=240015 RepID=C1F4W6_ACIC5|nr:hypothetical protein ACP_1240 [Acidobacterium capsulatum ATCC 51196]